MRRPSIQRGDPTQGERSYADRLLFHLRYSLGRRREDCTPDDIFRALALTVREELIEGMLDTEERVERADPKRLYYLSIEFLIGRLLKDMMLNLGIYEQCRAACAATRLDLDEALDYEPDAALGNGGLGRLAACFLDSLATLNLPAVGFGINYEYGLFRQELGVDGQREKPDQWLRRGSPWLLPRRDQGCIIPVYGNIVEGADLNGTYNPMWMDWRIVIGIPTDIPVPGYGGHTVNFLRLYSARSSDEFDMRIFNQGDYVKAVEQKISSENISKVLYPSDAVATGKELRLLQEYFLVACAMREIIRRYRKRHTTFDGFAGKVAVQLNDTHPALAVAELMRQLVDHYEVAWEKAWEITQGTFGYTNHTLLPEALEKWPVPLLKQVLPRHLQIIFEINRRFLEEVRVRYPGDEERARRMSLIEEGPVQLARMANLSIVGSHSVNGVAALHTELVKKLLVPDFHGLWPEKFNNKTNGVTPRRWLLNANPELASLITAAIGEGWKRDLGKLRALEAHATDAAFQQQFLRVKHANKGRLAQLAKRTVHAALDPAAIFDIHAKRIHEYKRQLLNVMHVIHLYRSITEEGRALPHPRTFLFAGKAAPGYFMAKLIIRLVHQVAQTIRADRRVSEQLQVVFLPDYRVSLAERIIPAADLSEQISTAGMEASGTGNMKFAMNGALTIGTLDGANIEILEEVGRENIYIFGLTAEEVQRARATGSHHPRACMEQSPAARRVMGSLESGMFSPGEPGLFRPIVEAILDRGDYYFHLADLDPYIAAQEQAARDFTNRGEWARRAILNVARMQKFSSDRTIAEYARDIWDLKAVE